MSEQRYEEFDDAEYTFSGKYTKACPGCMKEHVVFTQADKRPEYQTEVHILCDCGAFVTFVLPVN